LYGVDVVESVGMINSNCFDLRTSKIVNNNLDVDNMVIWHLAFGHVAIVIEVV